MSSPLQAPSLQTVEAAARRLLTAPGVDLSVATVRTVRHALEGQFGVSLTTPAEQRASVKAAILRAFDQGVCASLSLSLSRARARSRSLSGAVCVRASSTDGREYRGGAAEEEA